MKRLILVLVLVMCLPTLALANFASERPRWFRYLFETTNTHWTDVTPTYPWFPGFGVWPTLSAGDITAIKASSLYFKYWYPSSTVAAQHYVDGGHTAIDPNPVTMAAEKVKILDITLTRKMDAWFDVALEWDGLGGHWMQDGTIFDTNRATSYTNFKAHYEAMSPLWTYVSAPRRTRGFNLSVVNDYGSNVHYSYEWGVDMVLLERAIDEVGDIGTGMAFIRGAATQYNKPFGFDMSFWRTGANSATEYNSSARLIGGFSEDYTKRHAYLMYMGGANVVALEPVQVFLPSTETKSPIGTVSEAFGEFTTRHADRGVVNNPIALMLPWDHGFVPKHWLNNSDGVWYLHLSYGNGDYMLQNFFDVACPGYSNHGLTKPGYDWDDFEVFHQEIVAGLDPRPYEPMPSSRWGDIYDVLLDNATADALNRYRVIVLAGTHTISSDLRSRLSTWVTNGGILVLNTQHATSGDQTLMGVTLDGSTSTATSSLWTAGGGTNVESSFTYDNVTPTTATILATTTPGAELILSRTQGAGTVYTVTAQHMQNTAKTALLTISISLLDTLFQAQQTAWIDNSTMAYTTTVGAGFQTITVSNPTGSTWNGTVKFRQSNPIQASEWIPDSNLSHTGPSSGVVSVSVSVPAYGVKVFGLTSTPAKTGTPAVAAGLGVS